MLKKILLLALLVILILTFTVAYQFISRHLPAVSGFVALYACGDRFVSQRQNLPEVIADTLAASKFFSFSLVDVDGDRRRVTASLPFGLSPQTAVYRDYLGCTLTTGSSPHYLAEQLQSYDFSIAENVTGRPLPTGTKNLAMEVALDNAFAEPAEYSQRETRAIVVVKGGVVVGERYAPGFNTHSQLLGWSMTKSVLNALSGIQVRLGLLNLGDKGLFTEWLQDGRNEITIEHLLNMSSGLAFAEVYGIGEDATAMLFASGDASAFAIDKPLVHEPGTYWSYSSGTSNMLAHLLRERAGGSPAAFFEFAYRELFRPLGMASVVLQPDASGDIIGSSFMYATARDWARFGLLYLNNGRWEGQRILPEGWVSYTRQPLAHAPQGRYKSQFWLNAGTDAEGTGRRFPKLPKDMYYASGHDGQQVIILPSQDMVIVRLGRTLDNSWDTELFVAEAIASLE